MIYIDSNKTLYCSNQNRSGYEMYVCTRGKGIITNTHSTVSVRKCYNYGVLNVLWTTNGRALLLFYLGMMIDIVHNTVGMQTLIRCNLHNVFLLSIWRAHVLALEIHYSGQLMYEAVFKIVSELFRCHTTDKELFAFHRWTLTLEVSKTLSNLRRAFGTSVT